MKTLHHDEVFLTSIHNFLKEHNYFQMISLIQAVKMPMLILISVVMSIDFSKWPYFQMPEWFGFANVPAPILFKFLFYAILGDLLTGLMKSWTKNKVTKSKGFKRTGIKLGMYASIILSITILCNLFEYMDKDDKYDVMSVLNWAIIFLIFTELYSMLENLEEAFPKHPLVRFLVRPILKFLRGKIDKIDDFFDNNSPNTPSQP